MPVSAQRSPIGNQFYVIHQFVSRHHTAADITPGTVDGQRDCMTQNPLGSEPSLGRERGRVDRDATAPQAPVLADVTPEPRRYWTTCPSPH